MLVCPRTLPALALLALLPALLSAGCSKRRLQVGPSGFIDADGGTDLAESADGLTNATDTGTGPADAVGPPPVGPSFDAGPKSDCVRTVIRLPWTGSAGTIGRLDIAASGAGIAVMNRQGRELDVRTYRSDGAVIGGFQFGADTQFLPYSNGNFLLISRQLTGDFMATALDPTLTGGTRLYTATSNATERMLAATVTDGGIILITDEHFINLSAGRVLAWSTVLGVADVFKSARLYGIAALSDVVLLASGANRALRVDVVDVAGLSLGVATSPSFFGELGADAVSAIPWGSGLLMFDGNPVRMTEISFDQSVAVIGENTQLRAFYRTAPRVAAIRFGSGLVAFWLTVFPGTDNSQSITPHQLYGCELDLSAPASCGATAPIAHTGLPGSVELEPVAAAALPDGESFAIAHTDVSGGTWLRVADLSCATR